MKIENIKLEKLTPYARNSRTHSEEQVRQISASIQEFGFTNPVLVDGDGGIIAGHGRVLGARSAGLTSVPCIRLPHLTEAQRRAYVLADNKIALNAGWDDDLLARELSWLQAEGFDLSLTAFDMSETNAIFDSILETCGDGVGEDDVPPPQPRATSVVGDVWVMGEHRVLCGDATDAAVWDVLLGGDQIDLCWTDPPYNVAYEAKKSKNKQRPAGRPILGDNVSDKVFRAFLAGFYTAVFKHMRAGAPIYVAHAETERVNFTEQFLLAGFKLSSNIIWRKNSLVLGRSDFQYIHEPILYGWKPGAAHSWYGGRKQTTVRDCGEDGPAYLGDDGRWRIFAGDVVVLVDGDAVIEKHPLSVIHVDRPRASKLHPTMKPVALIKKLILLSARAGDIVADPFGGSGSTLIAAEQASMRARLVELSPHHVDTIVRRWQEFTGRPAKLESSGQEFPS